MATHSSILAWEIPWTKETDELQSMGSQKLDMTEPLSTRVCTCAHTRVHTHTHTHACFQGSIQAYGSGVRISVVCGVSWYLPGTQGARAAAESLSS